LRIFRKSVEKIQVSLKYDKNKGRSHEDKYAFPIISRSVLLRIKKSQTDVAEKIKTR